MMVPGNEMHPPEHVLLADAVWLRAFTHSLVRGSDLAEDVAQDTWLAGMSQRGVGDPPTRPWLAQVARNLAIKLLGRESRRQQVEQTMLGKDPSTSTDELVEEAEQQRAAVEALMALNEPYRTALLLRFMKGFSYLDVAARTDVPVETVRTRIKRGLVLLRARMDRKYGRAAWVPGVVTPALPAFSTLSLWSIALVKIKTKFAVAAGMLLVSILGIWYVSIGQASATADAPASTERMVATLPDQDNEDTRKAPERNPVELEESTESRTAGLVVHATWKATGEPAANVGIRIREGWGSLGHYASTDEGGTARFEGLEPGSFDLTMDRLVPDGRSWDVELEAGETEVFELEVGDGVDVRGTVVDEFGVPVADAQIVVAWGATSPRWNFPVAHSGGDGSFNLRSMGGINLIGARKPGYAPSDFQVVMRAKRTEGGEAILRLVLPGAAATLEGYVYDHEGRPVPGAWVTIGRSFALGVGPPQRYLHTDSEGLFTTILQAGTHSVYVYGQGFAPWRGSAECRALESTKLSVALQRGAILYGQVTDGEGMPVANVRVEAPYSFPQTARAVTDEEGRYRIEDLPGGEILAKVYHDQLGRVERTFQLVLGREQVWDIALEPGLRIHGVLLNQRGEPLAGWWLRNEKGTGVVVDDEGRFSFNNCEDRLYTLGVYQGFGFVPPVTTFEGVRPGAARQTFTVLDDSMPSARVRGRIYTPEGRPASEVDLALYQGGKPIGPAGETDGDGRFEAGPFPPGTYSMTGYLPEFVGVELGEFTLGVDETRQLPDARLGYGAHLNLSFAATDPRQLEGLDVRATHRERGQVYRGTVRRAQASFGLLRPGGYDLNIRGPNIEPLTLPIELRAQETRTVQVELRGR